MGQYIQRIDLRQLLRKVQTYDINHEVAADQILAWIDANYDIKPEPITYADEATKRHASNCHCPACESYRDMKNESELNALENQSPE